MIEAYVEAGVALAADSGVAAWSYAPELWGRCGQGPDEATALAALTDRPTVVVERVVGDEQAFSADLRPATPAQRDATLAILAQARAETVALIAGIPDDVLDRDDPDRVLPAFASWRTLRQMAWHLADTESRYYLPSLGLRPARAGPPSSTSWPPPPSTSAAPSWPPRPTCSAPARAGPGPPPNSSAASPGTNPRSW